jgi:PAS domain S-box-containing protein
MPREQFERVAQVLFLLSSQLSNAAYQNVQQERIIAGRLVIEERLRESEEKYRMLAESMKDVVWTLDAESERFVYVSPSVEGLRGFTVEEVLAAPASDAFPLQSREQLRELIQDRATAFVTGDPSRREFYTDEFEQPRKDGTTVWTESVYSFHVNEKSGRLEIRGITRDVSERKRAEDALRLSEARYRGLWTNLDAGIVVHAADTSIVMSNPRAAELLGLSEDQLHGRTAFDQEWRFLADSGDPLPLDQYPVNQIIATRAPLRSLIVGNNRPSIRGVAWASVNGVPVINDAGEIEEVLISFVDITDIKNAEAERADKEARQQALLDNAPYGAHMYELHDDDRLVFVGRNKRAEEILGLDHSELIGKTIEDAFPGNAGTETPDAYRRVAREGGTWETEQYAYDAEGIAGVFEVFAFSFGFNRVAVFFRDITDKRKLEVAVADSEAKLSAAQRYAHIGSWSWFVKTDQLEWSDEMFRLFGIDKDAFTGSLSDVITAAIHPDDREALDAANTSVSNEGKPVPLEYRVIRPDGSVRWVYAEAGELVTDDEGEPLILSGTVQDITDRKFAEMALAERTTELERSNHELESFAYVASHDLQEPLRMVASYTQLLQRRYQGQLDADADEFIGYAVDGATRMQQLLEDLLDYSRVNTRGAAAAPVDARVPLDEALRNLTVPIGETNAELEIGDLPVVMADKAQLMRVFQNLIGNAIKFRRPDASPRVQIEATHSGELWQFCVSDNGIGIDPDGFERVFEVFQRLNPRSDYPGTGIGLSICRRAIERLGGSIWIESSSPEGTTFCFTLRAAGREDV